MNPDLLWYPGLALLTAHVLVDFVVQSDRDVQDKARFRPTAFLRHALQHGVAAYVLVGAWAAWWIPVAVFAVHGAIDLLKESTRSLLRRTDRWTSTAGLRLFTADQIAHVASLVMITWWVGPRTVLTLGAESFVVSSLLPVYLVVTGLVITVRTGSIVIAHAVRRFEGSLQERQSEPDANLGVESRGLVGGGQMIGALERSLIFFFVLIGRVEGVGLLLAAKSILRFGDLNAQRQRVETEYVIIGTLMSFAWALGWAWLTAHLLVRL